jgi:hypothetical protein
MSVYSLGVDEIFRTSKPVFDALFPFVIIFATLPFTFWLYTKFRLLKEGKENGVSVIFKIFIFLFFIFYWQKIFIASFLLNDALEAKIQNIDISSVLPRDAEYRHMDNVVSQMVSDYQIEENKVAKRKSAILADMQEESGTGGAIKSFYQDLIAGNKATRELLEAGELSAKIKYLDPKHWIRVLLSLLAQIAKKLVFMLRIGFSYFYYFTVPFLLIASYMPVLGDNNDSSGLNSFSKKTISSFINMALWPTVYALLDIVLVIMYYTLRGQGLLDGFLEYTAFFCFYLIAYITLPISIQKANPYGVMQGMISTISTVATVGTIATTGIASTAGKTLASRGSNLISNLDLGKGNNG